MRFTGKTEFRSPVTSIVHRERREREGERRAIREGKGSKRKDWNRERQRRKYNK
jgi:hypothetical protein